MVPAAVLWAGEDYRQGHQATAGLRHFCLGVGRTILREPCLIAQAQTGRGPRGKMGLNRKRPIRGLKGTTTTRFPYCEEPTRILCVPLFPYAVSSQARAGTPASPQGTRGVGQAVNAPPLELFRGHRPHAPSRVARAFGAGHLHGGEAERWFLACFPPGDRTPRQKGQWDDFAVSLRSFTDFMHYHKKAWSKGKRNSMRARIRLYNLPLYPEIDIVDPRKALAFQRWLERQPRYYPHAVMLYLMQWLGMRYLEVARARASLQEPTFKVDWDGDWVRIWGKGRGGLSKLRSLPLAGETGSALEAYLGWRRTHGITSPWLFVTVGAVRGPRAPGDITRPSGSGACPFTTSGYARRGAPNSSSPMARSER